MTKCLALVRLYSLADKSPVELLPISIKGEFCSGDISLLSLPRLLTVTIELVQHNEKNSCHEVITMARSSVAVAKLQACVRKTVFMYGMALNLWPSSELTNTAN